jgi:hypothetical protein
MTLADLTTDIVQANNWRLDGKITRDEHATMIARITRIMDAYGWTWEDIHAEFDRSVTS